MRPAVAGLAFLVVVGALGVGFYLVGPPAEARAQRLDARRVADLQGLRIAVDLYWTRNGRLPESLDELAREPGTNIDTRDPETAEPYGYAVKAADGYELCATFARRSDMRSDFLVAWRGAPVFPGHGEADTALSDRDAPYVRSVRLQPDHDQVN